MNSCTSQHQAEFWRGHYFYAIDASSNDFPGFIRIVAVDHVAEMSALSPAVRTYLWDLLETTEETMRDSLAPDKMNLAGIRQYGATSTLACNRTLER